MSHRQDFKVIKCPACGTQNRVLKTNLANAVCGHCRRPLPLKASKAQVVVGVCVAVLVLSLLALWMFIPRDREAASPTPSRAPAARATTAPTQVAGTGTDSEPPPPRTSPDFSDPLSGPEGLIGALGADKDRLAELKKRLRATRGAEARRLLQDEIANLEESITEREGPCRDFFGGEGRANRGRGGAARLVIKNQTPAILNVTLVGADGQNVSITPGQSRDVNVGAGEYGVAVVPVSTTLQPCYGKWKLANRTYYATFVVGK